MAYHPPAGHVAHVGTTPFPSPSSQSLELRYRKNARTWLFLSVTSLTLAQSRLQGPLFFDRWQRGSQAREHPPLLRVDARRAGFGIQPHIQAWEKLEKVALSAAWNAVRPPSLHTPCAGASLRYLELARLRMLLHGLCTRPSKKRRRNSLVPLILG